MEPLAPPRATLDTSQKRARSPDPPVLHVPSLPSSSPHPAAGGGMPGFTADQVASLRLLIQSCLPLFRLKLLLLLWRRSFLPRPLLSLGLPRFWLFLSWIVTPILSRSPRGSLILLHRTVRMMRRPLLNLLICPTMRMEMTSTLLLAALAMTLFIWLRPRR